MKALDPLALILVIIGGLNWGLVAFLNLNLVTTLLGEGSLLSTVVYGVVALSAVYLAVTTLPKQLK